MMDLPLFPLNLVLFPGMPLNLHIFEERYKVMINQCIDERTPFGVVLIANEQLDTSANAEPHYIGCTAQIVQVQPLPEGKMNITAVGKDRFQVQSLQYDKPYLSGQVEMFPLTADNTTQIRHDTSYLRQRLIRYLAVLQRTKQMQFQTSNLPTDPAALAYLAAVLLQVDPQEKQPLLAIPNLDELVTSLLEIYRYEVALLETLINPPEDIDFRGIFSLN